MLLRFIDPQKMRDAYVAVQSIDPFSWWLFVGYVVLFSYLQFLRFLRLMLHEDILEQGKKLEPPAGTPP
jgi:hypothetical protein